MKVARLAVPMVVVGGMLLCAPLGATAEKKLQVPPVIKDTLREYPHPCVSAKHIQFTDVVDPIVL